MENLFAFDKKINLKNRKIIVNCRGVLIRDASIINKYCNTEKVKMACEEGCINYGKKWSCPPYSTKYTSFSEKYTNAILLVFSTKMKFYFDVKNKYTALKAANVTLKTLIEKCARNVEECVHGYSLLSGSCRLCKKCACKEKEKCKKPDKMRYSMEATLLDVDKLCEELLSYNLLWYYNRTLPEYTSTVAMVMFNDETPEDELKKIVVNTINNF